MTGIGLPDFATTCKKITNTNKNVCALSTFNTDLSRIVNPLQCHVAENHGRQVCDRADGIIRGPGRIT